jgi:hypothetical protein
MWFIDWADVFGNVVPPNDLPLVCGLVWAKLTAQEEEEGLALELARLFHPVLLSIYALIHRCSLNIIERKWWVRSYLGCYLGLADDDRHYVLEDSPLTCHLIMQVEELIEIDAISFERLATILYQGVEGRLDDVVIIEVRSIGAGVSLLHA